MNCLDILESIARQQVDLICNQPCVEPLPTPDYGWENLRFTSPLFRLAHVEIFRQPRFGVVHCCVFPHSTDPAPIYGFDVIASETKITGVFLDLSPTINPVEPFISINVGKSRIRPEWGDIFSPHWLACKPTPEELPIIGQESIRLLRVHIGMLGKTGPREQIIVAQNRYCLQQQKNEHTRRALINLIGLEKTNEFMEEILFPIIKI